MLASPALETTSRHTVIRILRPVASPLLCVMAGSTRHTERTPTMRRLWETRRAQIGNRQGFTLVELMIVVAIIGILAAIALTLYANVEARARLVKAQADLRALATAVSIYGTHMGNNPAALADLNAP